MNSLPTNTPRKQYCPISEMLRYPPFGLDAHICFGTADGETALIRTPEAHICTRQEFEELLPLLFAFFERHSDEEIADMQERWDNQNSQHLPLPKKQPAAGVVYLIYSEDSKLHKIGLTTQLPEQRMAGISMGNNEKLRLIHTIKSYDIRALEISWHDRFKDKRIRGEWFNLDADDVQEFCSTPDCV